MSAPTGGWGRPPWTDRGRPRGARWFAVIVAVLIQLPGVVLAARDAATDPVALGFTLLAFAASFLLLAGRSHPGLTVVLVAALCAPAIAVTTGPPFSAVPLAFAVVGAVVRGARVWAWWTLAGFAVAGPAAAYLLRGQPAAMIRPLIVALLLCLLVGVGEAVRNRRERYREVARSVAARREAAAEAERLRIARELHDVLAHSLSQISVQAGVGLHLFDSRPEKARESLEAIKTTSSQALEEVRGVLGFLRGPDGYAARSPEPDLARVPVLVETYRKAGLTVDYRPDLHSTPSAATQLALYRIVQEALTNIGRHAQASRATILLTEEPGWYVLSVQDDGRGLPGDVADADTGSTGRGMLGMRERAELLGGTFDARTPAEGGLLLEARLPAAVPAASSRPSSPSHPGGLS
ncbi:histidine kinase [Leifsonia shinshuensis]|uniref:histidine kinase n=1 Tax=Leifsonia shinshuensis TaxID=150026 RepID=UPI00286046E5|nr:histidine kinase [Leifsonia shinshuensis]MDR6970491.1 signal transduction histidine kinase [Leifsonia shinshuensis]